jgi:hypothetical protein
MQYENKSPVYTRHSRRVNTFACLETALGSDWLRSEAPSLEHSPERNRSNRRQKECMPELLESGPDIASLMDVPRS